MNPAALAGTEDHPQARMVLSTGLDAGPFGEELGGEGARGRALAGA